MNTPATLADPDTPFAVVDVHTMRRNIARLKDRADRLGVTLRPHVKTAKSLDVAAHLNSGTPCPVTVSTLAEAEAFADGGYTDITYAVGVEPRKLPRITALSRRGVTLRVLLDSAEQAAFVTEASRRAGIPLPAQIEIDCDGHRGGIRPGDPALVEIGRVLHDDGCLDGVLTHAGESYFARTAEDQCLAAKNERDTAVAAAERLRAAGLPVNTVSVGSTPTAHAADDLTGVTELRAGNYVFFDLVMAGLGVCRVEDIALSVVVTVIGHRPEHGWIMTDGGWMAMSRDRGTAAQAQDQGYGLVTDLAGRLIPGLVMTAASQEHGTLTARDGAALPRLPVGTRLRVLPNHACATAAQHRGYHTVDGTRPARPAPAIEAFWERVTGW
ncbi:alanine racemase [Streptomyces filipinensis]|uniref:Alanine racemase n=1 Tax=Streptomyces filipinensis TaxID=66887 RepID=A0A918ID90_9ACTN|nr:DSD1 family PLP-dependent enzyme [Streptomyces filipinensis]GGU97954.1 alanine racemase [Streptomyces filipinensis]